MSAIAPGDRIRLTLHRVGRMARRLRLDSLLVPITFGSGMRSSGTQILIAAPDLRTADPVIAAEIEAGRFVFAGQSVEAGGASPFSIIPPSPDWARQLHGFGWLRHMRGRGGGHGPYRAHTLIADWLGNPGEGSEQSSEPAVVSRRILSFLSQSNLILRDADHDFYQQFIRSILRQARSLRGSLSSTDGVVRLQSVIALAMTGLSLSDQEKLTKFGLDRLDQELDNQILPDGGHISRNPATLIAILVDILPLRQAMIARGLNPSDRVVRTIERMMPMLRFFRHSEGSFCHFNGMTASAADLIATILAYDEALGKPVMSASYSGYERVEAGDSVLIVDAGKPPSITFSQEAHASTLALEFSSGPQLLLVNCGAPASRHGELRRAARVTAAHSTATLNDDASCQFSGPQADAKIVAGPRSVECNRKTLSDGATCLAMSHDGYLRSHGWLHTRFVSLATDGLQLNGVDDFKLAANQATALPFTVRFHVHPSVEITDGRSERVVILEPPTGPRWQFQANFPLSVEESVFLSDMFGSRPTLQIVIDSKTGDNSAVEWSLQHIG